MKLSSVNATLEMIQPVKQLQFPYNPLLHPNIAFIYGWHLFVI